MRERWSNRKSRGRDNGDDGDDKTANHALEIKASINSPIPIRNDTKADRLGGVDNDRTSRMVSPRVMREVGHRRDKRRRVPWLVDKNSF